MAVVRRYSKCSFLSTLLILLTNCTVILSAAETKQDLYKLLGVERSATTQEIKTAYRRKALDTHPDKNRHMPQEQAAESFRQVVHAFEILSDEQSRTRYDRTGRSDANSANNNNSNRGGSNFYGGFTWNFQRKPVKLKDRFDVQEAKSRVLHIASLEHLQTVMMDDDDRLERNLLMVFCTPLAVETLVDDEIVFPYPFAAKSSQGIWWEDLLQTVKVRFQKQNDLTKHFNIPNGDSMRTTGKPIFVFGKRGQTLDEPWAQIETDSRTAFENWVWEQIQVKLHFVNRHDFPVELYWIHGSRAHERSPIQPGDTVEHTSMLSHEWYARDARVDSRHDSPGRYKLTQESSLGSWKIVNDTSPQEIVIETPICFDLSGHCLFWKQQGACTKNSVFMCEQCRLSCKNSCGGCNKKEEEPVVDGGKEKVQDEL